MMSVHLLCHVCASMMRVGATSPPTLAGAGHQRTNPTSMGSLLEVSWVDLAMESHLLQPVVVLTRSLVARTSKCGWGIRATSHMSYEPWPWYGEDPWLSSKVCTMGVGKAVLCSHGPSSIEWTENEPCCGIIAYFVGKKWGEDLV